LPQEKREIETLVLALGGNAIAGKSRNTFDAQYSAVRAATRQIARLAADYRIVITHGNGPQVGDALLRSEHSAGLVPSLPLYACVAETQGTIGSMIEAALVDWMMIMKRPAGKGAGAGPAGVATLVTHVEVSAGDPAFAGAPTKPVGPTYNEKSIAATARQFPVKEVTPGKYRRVVASPDPVSVVEAGAVGRLLDDGYIVIACGGGGIPVVKKRGGEGLSFVDAVVDKDLASERLATAIGATRLVCLTDVAGAYVDFRDSRHQRLIRRAHVEEMKSLLAAGHFEEGSMGPKVRASIRFAQNTGHSAVIAHLSRLEQAARLAAGTIVFTNDK
jgi:carbamate kinase